MSVCGYARCAIKEAYIVHSNGALGDNLGKRWGYFLEVFNREQGRFDMEKKHFNIFSKRIINVFNSARGSHKEEYVDHFASKNWKEKTFEERSRHSLKKCQECAVNHAKFQRQFDKKFSLKQPKGM